MIDSADGMQVRMTASLQGYRKSYFGEMPIGRRARVRPNLPELRRLLMCCVAKRNVGVWVLAAVISSAPLISEAKSWQFEWAKQDFQLYFRNNLSMGAAWRIEERDKSLIGKVNLQENRTLCAEDDCIALSRDNTEPNSRFLRAPGDYLQTLMMVI